MDKWLKKATPGDKGLTRPPASARVSAHKNEVRSIARGYFQSQFRVPAYKQVGRPTHDSQIREESLEKVTNVFMEQYTLPTDTNELPNLLTRNDVETWWLTNDEAINLRSENGWTIDLQLHTVTAATHDDDDTAVVANDETYETQLSAKMLPFQSGRPPHSTGGSREKTTMSSPLRRMSSYHRKRALFDMKARCMVCFAL